MKPIIIKFIFSIIFMNLCLANASIVGPNIVCLGNSASYSYTPPSGTSVLNYSWTFGDGGVSNQSNPSHTYGSTGKFKIKLEVNLNNSSSLVDSLDIEVFGLPKVSFYFLKESDTCFNHNVVCFGDSSSESKSGEKIVQRLMVWGDGTFSTYSNPSKFDTICHSFPASATYNLRMEIIDRNGCKNSDISSVNIVENIDAEFAFKKTFVDCNTIQYCLLNKSWGAIPANSHYRWYADTNSLDTGFYFNSPKCVSYNQSRSGSISLIAYANNNCRDTFKMNFDLEIDSLPTFMFLSDSVRCATDPSIIEASVRDIQRDSICWYFDGGVPPLLPINDDVFYRITNDYGVGTHEISVKIFRGSCIHEVKTNFRLLGPKSRIITVDNYQCFSNRKIFMFEKSIGVKRENCTFDWIIEDPYGDTCLAFHAQNINLYQNCNRSKDWYLKHSFKNFDNLIGVGLKVVDTTTGCTDSTLNVIVSDCSPILIPDTFHICQDGIFLDNLKDPLPDSFSIDRGKTWRYFPSKMLNVPTGIYDIGYMFINKISPWAEDYGNDSLNIHYDTLVYYDTIFKGQKLWIHDKEVDSVWVDLFSDCKPFLASVKFKNGTFHKGDRITISWSDPGGIDLLMDSFSTIDSFPHFYHRTGLSNDIRVILESRWGCKSVTDLFAEKGRNSALFRPQFMNCIRDSVCFTPTVYDMVKKEFWNANDPSRTLKWHILEDSTDKFSFNLCHRFKFGGLKQVQMITSDEYGCKDTMVDTFFVQEPKARIKKDGRYVVCSELKQFFDSSSYVINPPDIDFYPMYYRDSIKKYSWGFGNNVYNSFVKNPIQSINSSLDSIQAYHVVETVSGCSDTFVFFIKIIGPKPYFLIKDTIGCGSLEAEFINLSKNCKHYVWSFGDSLQSHLQTSSKQNVKFNYNLPGKYFINLTGIDTVFNFFTNKYQACSVTFPDKLFQSDTQRVVWVLPKLKTGIWGRDTVCRGDTINLLSLSDSNYLSDFWYIEDTLLKVLNSPSVLNYKFDQAGSVNISLKPFYNDGFKDKCRDSALKTVYVNDVLADFDIDTSSKPIFKFISKSRPIDAKHFWDIGGMSGSNDVNTEWNFGQDTGIHEVCLFIRTDFGCLDTMCKEIRQIVPPFLKLKIYNVFTPSNHDDLNDGFDIEIDGEEVYELSIYDRWGVKVYESKIDYDNDVNGNWNGKLNNTGLECPDGNYYFILKYKFKGESDAKLITGVVKLIR